MGLFKPKDPPNTVSDKDWRSLQDRARKAHPELDRLDDPDAIRLRETWAGQHDKRTQS